MPLRWSCGDACLNLVQHFIKMSCAKDTPEGRRYEALRLRCRWGQSIHCLIAVVAGKLVRSLFCVPQNGATTETCVPKDSRLPDQAVSQRCMQIKSHKSLMEGSSDFVLMYTSFTGPRHDQAGNYLRRIAILPLTDMRMHFMVAHLDFKQFDPTPTGQPHNFPTLFDCSYKEPPQPPKP